MANYYTLTCFAVKATQEQADYLLKLFDTFDRMIEEGDDFGPIDFYYQDIFAKMSAENFDQSLSVDTHYVVTNDKFYIDGDEGPNLDALSKLLEIYLAKFEIDLPITMSWATTCSKSVANAFGGGAAVIRRTGTKWMNTSQWLAENC